MGTGLPTPFGGTLVYELPLPTGAGWEAMSDGFLYRRPAGATSQLRRLRIRIEQETDGFGNTFLYSTIRFAAKGTELALPPPANATQHFEMDPDDAELGGSSFCLANDLGYAVGPSTAEQWLVNEPGRVAWRRNKFGD